MPQDYVILCLAAALGGAVNAIAGGGTLLTFPALFAALGTSPEAAVIANATSTVALVPGSVAALAGYRREIQQERPLGRALVGAQPDRRLHRLAAGRAAARASCSRRPCPG